MSYHVYRNKISYNYLYLLKSTSIKWAEVHIRSFQNPMHLFFSLSTTIIANPICNTSLKETNKNTVLYTK